MTQQTAGRGTDSSGFSSKWMLDGRTSAHPGGSSSGDANAAARAIDTDGDGVADTLALRVDAERPSLGGRVGSWLARSFVTLLVVAALLAAAVAATAWRSANDELERTTSQLDRQQALIDDLRAGEQRATRRAARLERQAGDATVGTARLQDERDELELEVRVLRGMLLDAEQQRAADAR